MKVGDRSRCRRCGGRIVIVKNPRVISLTAGLWVHVSATRRLLATHAPVPS